LSCFGALFFAARASAHENSPGVLALKEVAVGRFQLDWSPPSPDIVDLKVRLPGSCQVNGSGIFEPAFTEGLAGPLECGAAGLGGDLTFESKNASLGRIAVNVEWLDQSESFYLSSGNPPRVTLGAASPNDAFQVFRRYAALGVEHIWFGVDHLLFLLGLLIVVRGWRGLLTTVTAFTLAHSVTLALASLELVALPTRPVEICIALSVLLLAVEASRGPDTVARRWPWFVAFGFGLLHGLGFASALAEVGLPKGAVLLSLIGFNLGVELGQLVAVSIVAMGYLRLAPRPKLQRRVEWLAICALGACSVFWLFQRVEGWLGELGTLSG
jgi:hypothetical protein